MSLPREEAKQRLEKVFRAAFDDDGITLFDTMTAKDLSEWDSLMHISLVVAVEKEFRLRLNAAEVGKLDNVGAMIALLMERAS